MEKYLSANEIMSTLGISRSTVYSLLKLPDFPVTRIGKRILVSESALQAWLEKGGTEAREA